MGDTRDWLPEPNGAVLDQRPPSSSSSLFSSNQTVIGAVYWQRAEDATQGVIAQVQPTVVSENRRKAVIDYVQRLITSCLGCEVFPFGSVPLKTYLPDGDIDLTAFGGLNVEEALASDVFSVLEREDQNGAAEFIVKDVQLIRAEVKLVKCLVQNIVVDISFNQLGGLCTLCFLEQVDRKIGKDHLFKRSIILVKAWCYYESRILGAHHGLISTYALETLVLYIFHLFHASLNGPLAVLYKFLDYFSKFDWENYCISLNGPVRISSLPNLMAETPENDGSDLLLSSDFLKQCLEMFSVSSRSYEPNSRTFPPKHLNIVDPLKENNNLGRSVSKGNFYRIRSAFTYGARKLGRILSQPEVNIDDEIREFFSNTLDRHGSRQRPDVQDPVLASGHDMFGTTSLFSDTDSQEDQTIHESEHSYVNGMTGECRLGYEELMHGGLTNIKTSGASMSFGRALNEPKRSTTNASTSSIPDSDGSGNGITVSEHHLSGDAKDVAASRIQGLTISNDATKSPPSSRENGISPLDKAHHAPYGEGREGKEWPENSGYAENDFSGLQQAPHKEKPLITPCGLDDNQLVSDKHSLLSAGSKHQLSCLSSVAWSSEDLYPNRPAYRALNGTSGNPEALNSLSDLSGDYESHLNSLHNGRWCYEHASSASITPMSPLLVPQLHGKKPWDIIRQSVQLNRNVFSQMNANSVVPRSGFYRMNLPILPSGVVFGTEEMPKPRGTGTYFPNTNHYGDRPLTARGRNQAPVRSPRNNGGAILTPESNWSERSNHELAQAQLPVYGSGKSLPSYHTSGSPGRNVYSTANGSLHPSERAVEFGLIENLPVDGSLLERSGQKNYGSVLAQDSSGSLPLPGMQSPKAVVDMNQERIGVQSYRLKDEDDFPPLSV
ncbi:hypothetical protein F2P56_008112 [Juglans regia]|uniref:Uncharacterized protein LOC108982152 isoform X1 n=2 Tax=Juglans regia TaxID=51240 RepID=A0A2I4DPB8_JUGRE|nr:uncharacterized protein LOC108982152 isoform X1 [Juglans regia]KAF5476390.1 hypothetical protein F2P56_008112 [Juglans regia]